MTHPRDEHGHWRAISDEIDAVELALLVAEAEHAVVLAEAADGTNIPDARRPLTRAEITSGVRFGPIDQRIRTVADRITAATDDLAEHITTTVHDTIAAAPTVEEARRQVAAWASPIAPVILPGLAERAHRAVDDIRPDLEQAWSEGAGDVLAEAAHQGITPRVTPALTAEAAAIIGAAALAVVTQRATRLLTVANTTLATVAVPPPQAAVLVRDALVATPVAGTTDAARQAVHQAQTSARTTTVRGMIAAGHVPASFHSTEQLDSNTCSACSAVDGTQYATLDGVFADYREDGGCRWCAGGLRCRGFYVTVWDTETPATLQNPGPNVPPQPRDVSPMAPVAPPRPPSVPVPPPAVPPTGPPPVPPTAPGPAFGPRQRWVDDPDPRIAFRDDMHQAFEHAVDGMNLTVDSRVSKLAGRTWQVEVQAFDQNGKRVLLSQRTLDPAGRTIDHDLLVIAKSHQGRGIAGRLLDESFDLYRRNGIASVRVHANIDVGGYTWASRGYGWDMRHYRRIENVRGQVQALLNAIERHATTPEELTDLAALRAQAAAATDVATMPSPHDLSTIGHRPGRLNWAGRQGLLGSNWYGVIAL